MTYCWSALLMLLSIGTCYGAQWLVRQEGKAEHKLVESVHPVASFRSDFIADVIFAILLAALMALYGTFLPKDSFATLSWVVAFAVILVSWVVLRLIERLPQKLPFVRLLAKKVAYRILLLISTFLAIVSVGVLVQ